MTEGSKKSNILAENTVLRYFNLTPARLKFLVDSDWSAEDFLEAALTIPLELLGSLEKWLLTCRCKIFCKKHQKCF